MQRLNSIALAGFVFDLEHLELHEVSGARVTLRPRTLAVLNCLARKAGHVVTKDELMRAAWPDVVVTDDSLVQCIGELRRALKDEERRVLRTEPRRGYRLMTEQTSGGPCHEIGTIDFRQEIQFASGFDGVRLAYATSGTGPPLVRAAHWMTHVERDWHSAVYGEFITRLCRTHRLVRYDSRGCGLSDRAVPTATLEDEVRDLEHVVDAARLDRFALLGRSQGGAIAIRYAARHPERVTRLVILGGFSRGELRRGELSTSVEKVRAFGEVLKVGWGDPNSAIRQIWTTWLFPGATTAQQDSFNELQRLACAPHHAALIHLAVCSYDASEDLARVECPTLVIHNPDDAIVPFEEGRLIASMVRNGRLESFTSRNHQPLPGEPAFEAVMRRIEEFLGDGAALESESPLPRNRASTLRSVG